MDITTTSLMLLLLFTLYPITIVSGKLMNLYRDVVPRDYDKMEAPKPNPSQPAEVGLQITILSLDSLDESSMTYRCDLWFAQQWKDTRLKLSSGDNRTQVQNLPHDWLKYIWHPDSYFKNANHIQFHDLTVPNHFVWLHNDLSIEYVIKMNMLLSCPMSFEKYPHDKQKCRLQIESVSHKNEDMKFVWRSDIAPVLIQEGIVLPQLNLTSYLLNDCTTEYSSGNFSCLEVIFNFERHLGHFLFKTYLPTIIVVMVSWASFWMKQKEVMERVMLGVTSLIAILSQHSISDSNLPPVSYLKAIDVFMLLCTFFVFMSLIEFIAVHLLLKNVKVRAKTKNDYRNVLLLMENISNFLPDNATKHRDDFFKSNEKGDEETAEEEEFKRRRTALAMKVDRISRIVMPTLFIIFNVLYWVVFVNG